MAKRAQALADKLRAQDVRDKERDRERIRTRHREERWNLKKDVKRGYDLTAGGPEGGAVLDVGKGGGEEEEDDEEEDEEEGGAGEEEEEEDDDDDDQGKREPVVGKHSRPVSTARTTYQPVAVADLEDAALQLLKRRRT